MALPTLDATFASAADLPRRQMLAKWLVNSSFSGSIEDYWTLPEHHIWSKIAVATGCPRTEADYVSLPKNYVWSDIYNTIVGNVRIVVSGLGSEDSQYNGDYVFSGRENGYPYYVKSGVAEIGATPDGIWRFQSLSDGNHFISEGSGFSRPWFVSSWEGQGIDPSGLQMYYTIGNSIDRGEKEAIAWIAAATRGDEADMGKVATYISWPWRYQVASINTYLQKEYGFVTNNVANQDAMANYMEFLKRLNVWDDINFYRDFANAKSLNHGLGPSINFTRATNATYFDANGVMRFAPHNIIRNSQATGAIEGVIGDGGVMPNNWFAGPANGINRAIVGKGTQNGMPYIDVRYYGTNTYTENGSPAVTFPSVGFDVGSDVNAAQGETWTLSSYVSMVGGTTSGLTFQTNIYETDSGLNFLTSSGAAFTPTASLSRFSCVHTLSNANTAFAQGRIVFVIAAGATIDVTLRIAAPQLERNATASEYIPTTGSAKYDQPRFDHDPTTLECSGLLIEEQRTNLIEYSSDFGNAYWEKINITLGNNSTSPDGTTNANSILETTTNGFHIARVMGILTVNSVYTVSVFAKANGRSKFSLQVGGVQTADFDLTAVTATPVAASGSPSASITSVGNGWFRCTATRQSTGNGNVTVILLNDSGNAEYAGNASLGMYFWGAQAELGALATSYIPTTGSEMTRNADSAVVTPISGFYNQSEGTLFAEFSRYQTAGVANFLQFSAASPNQVVLETNATPPSTLQRFLVQTSAGTQASIAFSGVVANTVYRMIGAYAANSFQAAQSGTLGTEDTSGALPTVSRMNIGAGEYDTGGIYKILNGHIRRIAYYPKRLSNTLLQQLTT